MDKEKRKFFKHGKHMSGEEAFEALFREKGKNYPEEMKKEFIQLHEDMHEAFRKMKEKKKAFKEKWGDIVGDEDFFHHHGRHFGKFGHLEDSEKSEG